MKMVRFDLHDGGFVWINPATVAYIIDDTESGDGHCIINFIGSDENYVSVACSADAALEGLEL